MGSLFEEIGSKDTTVKNEGYHSTMMMNGNEESIMGDGGFFYKSSIAFGDVGDLTPPNGNGVIPSLIKQQ